MALVAITALTACTKDPNAPRRPRLPGSVKLLAPQADARIAQNDPSIGCTADPARGHGFRLAFDWEGVAGADGYDIEFKNVRAAVPAVSYHVTESSYERAWCNAFVRDFYLDDWIWRVAAIGIPVGATAPDTLWSEERKYGFEPCRVANDQNCWAPPD